MPIFISQDHWEISKNLMKPIVGWVCTLDPGGYKYDQIKTVPFLLFHKILIEIEKNEKNEYLKKMFKYLYLTCSNIFIEDEKEFKDDKSTKVIFKINFKINSKFNTIIFFEIYNLIKITKLNQKNTKLILI